ncbi:MAG: hypothetical protein MR740_07940 [Clostridium sp.]|nr:hypothetical protein [Clostridium sp.]
MLARATMQDIRDYGDWAYSLALDPTRSGYPTYCDGIKTKAEFLTAAKQALMRETEELLLFRMDGAVEGWISLTWIPEDGYLQVDSFNIRRGTRRALEELLTLLERHYSGYTAHFGFPGKTATRYAIFARRGFGVSNTHGTIRSSFRTTGRRRTQRGSRGSHGRALTGLRSIPPGSRYILGLQPHL